MCEQFLTPMDFARPGPARQSNRLEVAWLAVLFALALGCYFLARYPMGTWTIDDAGITYSYARSIAAGEGSTLFAEGMPVEGFSNPLSVAINGALIRAGLFHPLLTHVPLELGLFGLSVVLVFLWLRDAGIRKSIAFPASTFFLALQLLTPATLIWYSSGLENVQLTAAITALLWIHQRWLRGKFLPVLEAPLFLAISLIRPEAFLYPLALGAAFFCRVPFSRRGSLPATPWTRAVLVFLIVAGVGSLLLVARWQIFGDLLPNTYYAKASGTFQELNESGVGNNLRRYVFGELLFYRGTWLFLAAGALGIVLSRRYAPVAGLVFLLPAAVALPAFAGPDWMGEHRFGTALLTVVHLWSVFGAAGLAESLRARPGGVRTLGAALVGFAAVVTVAWCAWTGLPRYSSFVQQPHATFENVADGVGFVRLELQERLGLFSPNVLLADAGGSSFIGQLQSIDLLRLTDYHLARLFPAGDQLLQYIYFERGAELIEEHHRIPSYPGFEQDFFLAVEFANPHSGELMRYQIRRDLIEVSLRPADTAFLGEAGGIRLWRSRRNVPFAVPSGLARVELLVGQETPQAGSLELRVCIKHECDRLDPLQFHSFGGESLVTMTGRLYRQGFLIRAPAEMGQYPVVVEVLDGDTPLLRETLGEMTVGTTLSTSPFPDRLRPGAEPLLDRAFLLAQLSRQARPRLARAEYRSALDQYREAARVRSWAAASLYERLAGDSAAPVHPVLRKELEGLEVALVAELESLLERTRTRPGKHGRANARDRAASLIFNLRRLGFRDLGRTPAAGRLREMIEGELETELDDRERYRHLLRLVAIEPRDVGHQKALMRARRELAEHDGGRSGMAPSYYRAPND
ncbi:MAG: hypothetical protein OEM62_04260 [Acidobacteriota bacterium]|nr:hypothetical protein [Acidobacteriota bacterium]